jgi:hypothetical protein
MTLRRETLTLALDQAALAEIAGGVLAGDAVEAGHPTFQAARVGSDVLDVIDALNDLHALARYDRPVLDPDLFREAAVDLGTVRDEQRIARHDRANEALDGVAGQVGQL